MEKLYILLGVLALGAILYFSGDGFYRYPCQDPENWGKAECLPPICKANMTCTDQVVRKQVISEQVISEQVVTEQVVREQYVTSNPQ